MRLVVFRSFLSNTNIQVASNNIGSFSFLVNLYFANFNTLFLLSIHKIYIGMVVPIIWRDNWTLSFIKIISKIFIFIINNTIIIIITPPSSSCYLQTKGHLHQAVCQTIWLQGRCGRLKARLSAKTLQFQGKPFLKKTGGG